LHLNSRGGRAGSPSRPYTHHSTFVAQVTEPQIFVNHYPAFFARFISLDRGRPPCRPTNHFGPEKKRKMGRHGGRPSLVSCPRNKHAFRRRSSGGAFRAAQFGQFLSPKARCQDSLARRARNCMKGTISAESAAQGGLYFLDRGSFAYWSILLSRFQR